MEFIAPLGTQVFRGKVLNNVKVSITDKYLLIIGVGPDNTYEEHLLEIGSEEARTIIINNINYIKELFSTLNNMIYEIGLELNANFSISNIELTDPLQYVLNALRQHDDYLKVVGDAWRRILDGIKLGKVTISLPGQDRIYVTHSGNNVTLNLVAEPIEDGVIEIITYTEGKVTGIVRVRVGEDVVVKVDIRSPSSLVILSQAKDLDRLGKPFTELMPRVRDHVIKYVDEILSIMRRYGAI